MEALVLLENAHLVYKDVPFPQKPDGKYYLIKVQACGICGSDMHRAFEGGAYHYPLIMGHEFSGIIEKAFPGAKYKEGTKVCVFPLIPCRKCPACQTGDYAQCSDYSYFGSRQDGAFARYLYAPEENIFPLPSHVDIIHAAMTEPCAVALHGVRKLKITGGETGVVYGGGPVGNVSAQLLRIRGCRRVMVVDINEEKLKIARNMGFEVINALKEDPVSVVKEYTSDQGADIVVEACGLALTYCQAIQSAACFGEVLLLGNLSEELVLSQEQSSSILRKELIIYGTWNSKIVPRGKDDWSTVLLFMDKKLSVAPLISHIPSLKQGPEIFLKMYKKQGFYNKVIFKIDPEII